MRMILMENSETERLEVPPHTLSVLVEATWIALGVLLIALGVLLIALGVCLLVAPLFWGLGFRAPRTCRRSNAGLELRRESRISMCPKHTPASLLPVYS